VRVYAGGGRGERGEKKGREGENWVGAGEGPRRKKFKRKREEKETTPYRSRPTLSLLEA
jgi:hypothetical protein